MGHLAMPNMPHQGSPVSQTVRAVRSFPGPMLSSKALPAAASARRAVGTAAGLL